MKSSKSLSSLLYYKFYKSWTKRTTKNDRRGDKHKGQTKLKWGDKHNKHTKHVWTCLDKLKIIKIINMESSTTLSSLL